MAQAPLRDGPVRLLALTKSTGGLAHYHRTLTARLDPERFMVHTLCLSENAEAYAEELRALGGGAEALAMNRYGVDPAGDFRLLRRAAAAARRFAPDVIVCHGAKPGLIGRAIGRITRTPTIYCQHSMPFLRRVQGAKAPIYHALELAGRALGGHMVTLTHRARSVTAAARIASPARMTVIHTGIDTERFRPRGRRDAVLADLGLDPAGPVVGWLGRFEKQKAPDDFAEAVALIARARPDARFVVAGEGALKEEFAARIAADGLSGRVTLLPWQPDTARLFEAFDVYALSSRWEGLPITLLEAMASGVAVATTDVDGCPEVVENGREGLIAPAGQPAALAAAVVRMLDDPDLRVAMAAAARRRVETDFALPGMVEKWSALIDALARGAAADQPAVALASLAR